MGNTDMRLSGTLTSPIELGGHLTNETLQGLSSYEVAVANGFTGTEAEWLASLKGETGATPNISIGDVTTGQPGTNAEASVSGTPENPVMDFIIPRGDIGATPNMTIGTVATGQEGTYAQATITGTPEDPVLNLTIPRGDTGDAGFDPIVEVTKNGNTATVSVTDATHTTEVNIVDGYTPQKNVDYFDGHSPVITGSKSQGTTFIYSDGEQIGAIADGEDGYTPRKGVDYFDGHTPAISGEKIDDTTFIYADGVRIATVLDGIDGNSPVITTVKSGKTTSILADSVVIGTISDGADGHSPTITTTKSGKTTTILSDGASIGSVADGQDGHSPEITTNKVGKVLTILSDGSAIGTVSDGADGVTPTITTNKSGTTTTIYSNGSPIGSIEDGPKGDDGDTPEITTSKTGKTTTIYADGSPIGTVDDGADGTTPSITASKSGSVTTISVNGNPIAEINDGTPGQDGTPAIIDATPTEDSPNAVSSGGVYTELSDVKETLNNKYEKPSTGIPASDIASGVIPDVSGKADKVQSATSGNFASLDANGNLMDSGHKHSDYLTEHQDLTDYVKNDDYASSSVGGVVKLSSSIGMNSSNQIGMIPATNADVQDGSNGINGITPSRQHRAVFYGLAKAAGDTTQSSSSNTVGTYTETAQSKIHEMLDAPATVSGTTPTITGKSGIRYICGEVSTLSITPPASGIIDVIFTSGSTPTVLTVPSTVKFPEWFDPTSLVANTTYEINIADGVYGAVMAWT